LAAELNDGEPEDENPTDVVEQDSQHVFDGVAKPESQHPYKHQVEGVDHVKPEEVQWHG
jgi:hypothetical protein